MSAPIEQTCESHLPSKAAILQDEATSPVAMECHHCISHHNEKSKRTRKSRPPIYRNLSGNATRVQHEIVMIHRALIAPRSRTGTAENP